MSEIPVVDLRPYQPKSISQLAQEIGGDESETLQQVKAAERQHFRAYGVRPFEIYFDPVLGETIRCNSSIGYVKTRDCVLRLLSSIDDLEISKCIGVAQRCEFNFLSRYRDEIEKRRLSDRDNYDAIDFFAQSLMAATTVVVANGLHRRFSRQQQESTKLSGQLNIKESIETAKLTTRPIAEEVVADYDIPPNKLIVTALTTCRDRCTSKPVIRWGESLISSLRGAKPYASSDQLETISPSYFPVPRADYEQALLLSNLVLNGSNWEKGPEASFLPLFTLDLDRLFERYVSVTLSRLLNQEKFEVSLQRSMDHPSKPRISTKQFVPDVIVGLKQKKSSPIVLDVKNKYRAVSEHAVESVSNDDLFQISYYTHALKAPLALLVYPGNGRQSTHYPLKSSEGETAYQAKREKAYREVFAKNRMILFEGYKNVEIDLVKWIVDMTGTLHNTERSVASLAQFLADYLENPLAIA